MRFTEGLRRGGVLAKVLITQHNIPMAAGASRGALHPDKVNAGVEIYLTDFLKSRFLGKNAKNRGVFAGNVINTRRVYCTDIKHVTITDLPHFKSPAPRTAAFGS